MGEDTTGLKPVLVERLAEAKKKRPIDLDEEDDPPAKKPKAAPSTAGWFWASDVSQTERQWTPYPAATCATLEAAFLAGAKQEKISDTHLVDLSAGGSASTAILTFLQRRKDNVSLQRPVARTADGVMPAQPPPKPVHLSKSGGGSGGGAVAAAAAAAASVPAAASAAAAAGSSSAVVGAKSVKAGGVSQVRYTSTAGTSSKDGGVRTERVKGRAAVDPSCPHEETCHVYDDGKSVYDALLNQTDIGQNKNKYYIIQLLETDAQPPKYYTWNRWGRVGEERAMQNAARGPMGLAEAKADFEKKFHDKTKNAWAGRDHFAAVPGKYTLIERDYGEEEEAAAKKAGAGSSKAAAEAAPAKPVESQLDKRVQSFMSLIADIRMMERSMREIGFDPAKMPLGKLKKSTIMAGYQALKELGEIIRAAGGSVAGGASGKAIASKSMGAVEISHASSEYKQV